MITCTVKLKPTPRQERKLQHWLWHLTGVWNWAVRKIELDAKDGIYHSAFNFTYYVKGHSKRLGIPIDVIVGTTDTAVLAWKRCFDKVSKRPRLKGLRNRMNSIPFKRTIHRPVGQRIDVRGIKGLKFHKQDIPEGRIRCGRIVRRASGWYLCLVIDADPKVITVVDDASVGIDTGFSTLLTLSSGEKIEHPHELRRTAERLSQAQRGRRKRLTARLMEHQRNQRKDRNHKVSRDLVSRHALIAWSKDSHRGLARMFGKSVAGAAHGHLREMVEAKCRTGGRRFVEVSGRYSTMTCSACLARSGPTGYPGLKVRQWVCSRCGCEHDRDVNAAIVTLNAGLGMSLERGRKAASGIAI